MNFDFDNRASKLEKDAAKRREDAKRRKEREFQQQAIARQHEEEMAELMRLRKLEEEEKESERQRLIAAERALTGGVEYTATLIPYATEGEDDKVLLPETALGHLTTQDAFTNGPAMFQLTVSDATISSMTGTGTGPTVTTVEKKMTHCGVREFSAAPDTIGLPRKVIDSLYPDGNITDNITIKYVRLPKITYVKLEPAANSFFQIAPVSKPTATTNQRIPTIKRNLILTLTLTNPLMPNSN